MKSVVYQSKSNSTNAVVVYSTVGIYMLRNNTNLYDYEITTSALEPASFNISIQVGGYNRMKWIRICSISYEKIATTISTPYFLDLGFLTGLSNTIPDTSGVTVSDLGTIFTGMTNWKINDINSVLNYEI